MTATTLTIAIVTTLLVALFTAAAVAVRSVSRIWLRHWTERRLSGASLAELYLERPQRLLITAGTGVALTVFVAGASLGAGDRSASAVAWRLLAVAIAVLLLGQLVPRAIARRWPVVLVPVLIPILRGLDLVVAPFRRVGAALAKPFCDRVKRAPAEEALSDIEELLREGAREGVGESEEMAIITGVVQFGEKHARDVMTPRSDIFAVRRSDSAAVVARSIARSAYSRIPVYDASLDEIGGMVRAFDVLRSGGDEWPPVRPVATATPDTPCNELLFSMLRTRRHMAIVRGPSNETLGLVTLEDLLEELVGDIRDEHDEPAP